VQSLGKFYLFSSTGIYQPGVLLLFFFVPSHQLSMIFVPKQTLQTWYYRRVPHDLGRNSLPRTLPLDFSRVVSPNLITQCTAYGACIQILVLITAV
jgi:hypothetical protein